MQAQVKVEPTLDSTMGPKSITSLFSCPICDGKFLSVALAKEHVIVLHKIPKERHVLFNIQFQKIEI